MANHQFSESVIALAGICQAIQCVQSIAKTGSANENAMNILFASTLKLDAESTEDVYDSYTNLSYGFKTIVEQLSGSKTEPDFGRYLINILSLQKQFSRSDSMQRVMGSRIQQATRLVQYQASETVSQDSIEQLASIYKDTISTFSTKIQVTGNSQHLEKPANQAKIRALLLSAIRSATLWSQVGGKKRHFFLQKNKIIESAQSFLKKLKS